MTSSKTSENQPKEENNESKIELASALEKVFSVLADRTAILTENIDIEKIISC